MVNYTLLISITLLYLTFLFMLAFLGEKYKEKISSYNLNPYIYVLAIGVYCTSWTYYGSIGVAANDGLGFLAIYIGPTLAASFWWVLLRKLVRIKSEYNISTLSDLISLRYGKSSSLAGLVSLLIFLGITPYISLQLKAVSDSFKILVNHENLIFPYIDPTLFFAILLGIFTIIFGSKNLDFTQRQSGLMTAIAAESIVKLVAFLIGGIYITYYIFNGFSEVFSFIANDYDYINLFSLSAKGSQTYFRWFSLLILSFFAVMFLPRQFHVLVVQNQDENDIKKASWLFPLYLLVINIFVLPVAFGGLLLNMPPERADQFILDIPLLFKNTSIATMIYLGGFSAATAMIIVSTLAVSKMITNDILIPWILRKEREFTHYSLILFFTRASIIFVIVLGYFYTKIVSEGYLLGEIGLVSFVAIAQFAPVILIGLYWKSANRKGAFSGIITGFIVWFYTLIIPILVKGELLPNSIIENGLLGLNFLKPYELFGLKGFDIIGNSVFWTLFLNCFALIVVSLSTSQTYEEKMQAEAFVDVFKKSRFRQREESETSVDEMKSIVEKIGGEIRSKNILKSILELKHENVNLPVSKVMGLRGRLERLISPFVGSASARRIVQDKLVISKDDAERLVESFHEIEGSLQESRKRIEEKEDEIKKREQFLSSLFRSIDDCIISTDLEGNILSVNNAGVGMFGYSELEMIGKSFSFLISGDDRKKKVAEIVRVTYIEGNWKGEIQVVTQKGNMLPCYLSTSQIFDKNWETIGMVGVIRDVKGLKQMQEKIIQSQKMASLGEMAASVAHEIRNPLGGIKIGVSNIENELSKNNEGLTVVREGIRSIETIVTEILNYTRDIKLELDEYNLSKIVKSAVSNYEKECKKKKIDVEYLNFDNSVNAMVDGIKMKQVFLNIIKNSIDAITKSGGKIRISLFSENNHAGIVIADNGIGIEREHLKKVFFPFYTTKTSGVGLGMAIVKKFIDLHRGKIKVESEKHKGTVIKITIPVNQKEPFWSQH